MSRDVVVGVVSVRGQWAWPVGVIGGTIWWGVDSGCMVNWVGIEVWSVGTASGGGQWV